jgi:predicted nucleic acid-binding protein
MMRLLIDTNVLLDVFFQREPHVRASAEVWQACEDGLCEGYISSLTPVNIYYIAQKQSSKAKARDLVIETLGVFGVAPLGLVELEAALQMDFPDYEDAVQVAAALSMGVDAVVTRNQDDFTKSALPVYSPIEVLKLIRA